MENTNNILKEISINFQLSATFIKLRYSKFYSNNIFILITFSFSNCSNTIKYLRDKVILSL
uniref:Uncharacterized protein n=1 Tax=Bacillus thuringiensis subsp. israelensis TaxID=1430 RepID=Q8KNW3_BACTI|nr:hypothetical protein [Bacillus thuringiensis serovar israelensis]CAD30077.1 hypothetical protein [Bacillus thuringiensis serovar israelensis]